MLRRQISEEITSTISIAWYFTTKSDGIWYITEYTFPGVITGYFTHLAYVRLAP